MNYLTLFQGSGDFENNVRKPQQIYFFNLARPPKIPLMPANVTLCEGFGFICAHNPVRIYLIAYIFLIERKSKLWQYDYF